MLEYWSAACCCSVENELIIIHPRSRITYRIQNRRVPLLEDEDSQGAAAPSYNKLVFEIPTRLNVMIEEVIGALGGVIG